MTVPNGSSGGFFAGSQTPFVMGVVPIVGQPPGLNAGPPAAAWSGDPVAERVSRHREAGALSTGVRPGSPAEKALCAARGDPPNSESTIASVSATSAGGASASAAPASVAEIKAERAAAAEAARVAQEREARSLVAKAREAEAAGKPAVARIYYQQAARRASGELKDTCLARAAALGPAKTSGRSR